MWQNKDEENSAITQIDAEALGRAECGETANRVGRACSALFVAIFVSGVCGLLLYLFAVSGRDLADTPQLFIVTVVLTVPLIVGVVMVWRRLLVRQVCWKTDVSGLTVNGIIRRWFIPWHRMTSAEIRQSRFGKPHYVIGDRGRDFHLSPAVMENVGFLDSLEYHLALHHLKDEWNAVLWGRGSDSGDSGLPVIEFRDESVSASGIVAFGGAFVFLCRGAGRVLQMLEGNAHQTQWLCAVWITASAILLREIGIVCRYLCTDRYIRSDSQGLTISRIWRSRFIPWSDIEDVWVDRRPLRRPRIMLRHEDRNFGLSASSSGNWRLVSSISQHLSAYGKGEGLMNSARLNNI